MIIGSNVILFPYKERHVLKYHSWMQNSDLLELTASEPLTLVEEYEMQKSWLNDEDKCTFIILDKETFEHTNDEVESAFRSKGRGRESLYLMFRYAMDHFQLEEFIAKIKMKNSTSLNLFSSIGFIKVDESHIFQEITMTCKVTPGWISDILSKTKMYRVENLDNKFNAIYLQYIL